MKNPKSGNRWVFVLIIFIFLFFHHMDLIILGSMMADTLGSVGDSSFWVDPIIIVGVIMGTAFYIFWGIFYDQHSRKKILSIIAFLWGTTSLLMGIAPTYSTFAISTAASMIDNGSYSGIFALTGDFFSPRNRGKILGVLFLAQPLSILITLIMINTSEGSVNWRLLLIVMAIIGFALSIIIYLFLHEPKRGASEPALIEIQMTGIYILDWEIAKEILKKPVMILMFAFSFFCAVPLAVFTVWLIPFLSEVQAVHSSQIFLVVIPCLIALSVGYPLGGFLGDSLFRKQKDGRVKIMMAGVLLASLCLLIAFQMTNFQAQPFIILLVLVSLFMGFTWPNLMASVLDVTLPEVRGFTNGIVVLFHSFGTFIAPVLLSILQVQIGLSGAILWMCLGAWLICLLLLVGLLFFVSDDIEHLRKHMAYRSHLEAQFENQRKY